MISLQLRNKSKIDAIPIFPSLFCYLLFIFLIAHKHETRKSKTQQATTTTQRIGRTNLPDPKSKPKAFAVAYLRESIFF